jgi:hypothetical protein
MWKPPPPRPGRSGEPSPITSGVVVCHATCRLVAACGTASHHVDASGARVRRAGRSWWVRCGPCMWSCIEAFCARSRFCLYVCRLGDAADCERRDDGGVEERKLDDGEAR